LVNPFLAAVLAGESDSPILDILGVLVRWENEVVLDRHVEIDGDKFLKDEVVLGKVAIIEVEWIAYFGNSKVMNTE
jgi:hypothetical protein